MKVQAFGRTDLRVSEYGLGCARIGGIFQSGGGGFVELLSAARDAGINFYDTADMYCQGESEALLGRAFRDVRSKVIIASKAGYRLPAQRQLAARLKPLLRPAIRLLGIRRDKLPASVRGQIEQDFEPDYLTRAVEASLRRLRTDYLDLIQLHSPPLDVVERGAWEPALEKLKRAGKVRYYGISCDTLDVGRAALRFPGVSCIQFPVNLLEQGAVEGLLPELRAAGAAGIARESLANGLLVKPASEVDLSKYCKSLEQQAERAEQLVNYRQKAEEQQRSLANLALNFVNELPGVSVTLVGVSNLKQLQSLLAQTVRGAAGTSPERALDAAGSA